MQPSAYPTAEHLRIAKELKRHGKYKRILSGGWLGRVKHSLGVGGPAPEMSDDALARIVQYVAKEKANERFSAATDRHHYQIPIEDRVEARRFAFEVENNYRGDGVAIPWLTILALIVWVYRIWSWIEERREPKGTSHGNRK